MNLPKTSRHKIRANVPLAPFTTLGIGGVARYLYEPKDRRELVRFLEDAPPSLSFFVIGSGSNLLIREGVIDKVFIRLAARDFNKIKISGRDVAVGAGAKIGRLVSVLSSRHLGGYEFLAGIPGTVGGCLSMNAGARCDWDSGSSYKEMKDIVREVEVLDRAGRLMRLGRKDIRFSYRNSSLRPYIILSAHLRLAAEDKDLVQQRLKKNIQARIKRQDWQYPSCGSFFKNPGGSLSAGELIDRCGLKGLKAGGAQVSERHANFFINSGKATSRDMLRLMEMVAKKVYNRFHVRLVPEVEIVP